MGGCGSGDWSRWGAKYAVEDYRSLDIRRLKRQGALESGRFSTISWTAGEKDVGSIGICPVDDSLFLIYRFRDGSDAAWRGVIDEIKLIWTPCNFGGRRPWFVCPGFKGKPCGRRVAKLYSGRYYRCRTCHNLTYRSRNESYQERAESQMKKLRKRLGVDPDTSSGSIKRPKGMHRRTFDHLIRRLEDVEERQMNAELDWMMRFVEIPDDQVIDLFREALSHDKDLIRSIIPAKLPYLRKLYGV